MKTFSYNGSAGQLTEVLDCVEAHREEVVITRARHEPAVVPSTNHSEKLRA